jgi:hypothetical protein
VELLWRRFSKLRLEHCSALLLGPAFEADLELLPLCGMEPFDQLLLEPLHLLDPHLILTLETGLFLDLP